MGKNTLAYYRKQAAQAKSREELQAISYAALRDDPECTVFSRKYDKIVALCVRREMKLKEEC